jgi:hypothetical protein
MSNCIPDATQIRNCTMLHKEEGQFITDIKCMNPVHPSDISHNNYLLQTLKVMNMHLNQVDIAKDKNFEDSSVWLSLAFKKVKDDLVRMEKIKRCMKKRMRVCKQEKKCITQQFKRASLEADTIIERLAPMSKQMPESV